jgi:hypothetical protein
MHHQIRLKCSNYGGQDGQDEKCTKQKSTVGILDGKRTPKEPR